MLLSPFEENPSSSGRARGKELSESFGEGRCDGCEKRSSVLSSSRRDKVMALYCRLGINRFFDRASGRR